MFEMERANGCVLFDLRELPNGKQEAQPGSGWASIAGETARRIQGTGELDSDVRWLTNLNKTWYWKSGMQRQSAKYKPANYLRAELQSLMREWGVIPAHGGLDTPRAAEIIAEIFSRVMLRVQGWYGLGEMNGDALVEDIRRAVVPPEARQSVQMNEALSRSFVELVSCERSDLLLPGHNEDRTRFITLRRPRVLHARTVMEMMVPEDGHWELLGPDDMPPEEKRLDWLLSKNRALLARVAIKGFHKREDSINLSSLLMLGQTRGAGKSMKDRDWVSQPELIYLSGLADLRIKAVFIGAPLTPLKQLKDLPPPTPLEDMSPSFGLMAECHWVAQASRQRDPSTHEKNIVTPRAAWMRANDRFETFVPALMLKERSLDVVSYGVGAVTIAARGHQADEIADAALHSGLLTPLTMRNELDELSSGKREADKFSRLTGED